MEEKRASNKTGRFTFKNKSMGRKVLYFEAEFLLAKIPGRHVTAGIYWKKATIADILEIFGNDKNYVHEES
jgi:hypothetical protein